MKITNRDRAYEQVLSLPKGKRTRPRRPAKPVRWLLKTASLPELQQVHFTCEQVGMQKLKQGEPALFLMNHSSFIDLKIAAALLYPRPFNIVCTSDGFVGKAGLMGALGCIPTQKFVSDPALVKDMVYAIKTLRDSVLLYPEASYTFDGTATPLPKTLGKLIKLLKVPVVMILTRGAFLRDPLYNMLQVRKVPVSARMTYLLSPEDCQTKSVEELNRVLSEAFTFDNFRDQQQQGLRVTEPFRADGLNRVLYRCPACEGEGAMEGKGTTLTCHRCGRKWELTETGFLQGINGDTVFSHVPDWYAWERQTVRRQILEGTYRLDIPVTIRMLVDKKCLYTVGKGRLIHDRDGFLLTGCEGKLTYRQSPAASYSLYADYYWYELGDMICIGDGNTLYYCFPREPGDVVARTRLAAEELYKLQEEGK
ncbi:MAG: hypothetical protein IJR17_03645 [Clostridia bacterium]|nr:hypothetical protein [Clostridia bacterium]